LNIEHFTRPENVEQMRRGDPSLSYTRNSYKSSIGASLLEKSQQLSSIPNRVLKYDIQRVELNAYIDLPYNVLLAKIHKE